MKQRLLLVFYSFLLITLKASAQENKSLPAASSSLSSIESNRISAVSSRFDMEQNSPNPFNTVTDIRFSMPVQGFVEFKVVNLIGKEVMRQVMEADPGKNVFHVDGSDFMPGVYIYSLSNGSQTLTRRMVISRK